MNTVVILFLSHGQENDIPLMLNGLFENVKVYAQFSSKLLMVPKVYALSHSFFYIFGTLDYIHFHAQTVLWY